MMKRPGSGVRSAWLGLAQAIELALQVLLPVLLVRHLTAEAFAGYRLFWLVAGTAAGLLPLAVPHALLVILPRSTAADRQAHSAVALLYMGLCGLISGLLAGFGLAAVTADPTVQDLALIFGLFTGLWVTGVLLDHLPLADENGVWQAKTSIGLAMVRTALAAWAVLQWQALTPVLWTLVATALFRVLAVGAYAQREHHVIGAHIERRHVRHLFEVALPQGIAGVLFSLRRQGDQWMAALMFSPAQFAAFSLGAVFSPLVMLLRRAVSSTLLPGMARHHAAGDWAAVLATNHRANAAVACVALPVLTFAWCFGEVIYDLIYTPTYRAAVPVMRVLAISWMLQVIEFNSLVILAKLMSRVARMNLALLVVSLAVSALGGWLFGLTGLALGGLAVALVERSLIARMLSKNLKLPVAQIQPWSTLVGISAASWALSIAGRLAYGQLPAQWHPLAGLALVAAVLPLPFWLMARRFGWWPKSMEVSTTSTR